MRNTICLIIVSIFVFSGGEACSKEVYEPDELIKRGEYFYDKETNELVSGLGRVYYQTGELKNESFF